jgi:hypothetical protein
MGLKKINKAAAVFAAAALFYKYTWLIFLKR